MGLKELNWQLAQIQQMHEGIILLENELRKIGDGTKKSSFEISLIEKEMDRLKMQICKISGPGFLAVPVACFACS